MRLSDISFLSAGMQGMQKQEVQAMMNADERR
jgi:hypothetical protein